MNWEEAGKKNAAFFDESCKLHGSVGWKASNFFSQDSQAGVHQILLSRLPIGDKTLLDVGCGQADLVTALARWPQKPQSYHGIDVSGEMIAQSRKKYGDEFFTHGNFLDPSRSFEYDVVIGAGPFNYRVAPDDADQFRYLQEAIAKMFTSCKVACSFTLLSGHGYEYARNFDTLACYEPWDVLRFCMTLTSAVVIDHASLPAEFAVFMYRDE